MIAQCLAGLYILASALGLQNGNFHQSRNGVPDNWQPVGQYKLIPDGGDNGIPAIELVNSGKGQSSLLQTVKFPTPRKESLTVTAWIRIDDLGAGGDCCLWLDAAQADGKPIWGSCGQPDRQKRGWQKLCANIIPQQPLTEVQVYLMLRDVKGKVRFSNVQMTDLHVDISNSRLCPTAPDLYDYRADLSTPADWRATAFQGNKEIWSKTGHGWRVAEQFTAKGKEKVEVRLAAGDSNITAATAPRKDKRAVDWWTASSLVRVFQDDLPPLKSSKDAVLDTARNDRESFQLCLRPYGKDISNAKVAVSDLVGDKGRIPASSITWNRVGYVHVETPLQHPNTPRHESAWWPDPLLAPVPFNVKVGEVQPLWFTLYVPENTEPGAYKGRISVQSDNDQTVSFYIRVSVHPAKVPVTGYMKTAFALMDGHMENLYGKITPELRRAYTDFLLQHRLNPDDISRITYPDLDELSYANTRGLNAFNILNIVPVPDKRVTWVCYGELKDYTPEFKQQFLERLDKIAPELDKRGLLDKAYIYGFDERGPEYIPVIRDLFGEIKKRYPRIHTLSTCWPPAGTDPLSMNIDWFVPLTSSYNPKLAEDVRRRGGEMWWYICCGPSYPYANWLLEHPLIESRLIWWQAFQNDVEGFLYWGLNIWERKNNDKPIPDNAGPRLDWSLTTGGEYESLNGDGVLLFPGEKGPLGGIRLENIRDGLEDTELLKQYKARFGQAKTDEILRKVTTGRTAFSIDPKVLQEARAELLDSL